MIDVNSIYEYCLWQLNKEQSGNSLSPDQFNSGLAWSNLEYFKLKYGLSEDYQAGDPLRPLLMRFRRKLWMICVLLEQSLEVKMPLHYQ